MFSYFKCKWVFFLWRKKCFSHFGMYRQLVNSLWISEKNSKCLLFFRFQFTFRFKVGKVWLIWMVNHKVNIVPINLFVVAVIISAICLNNFFVFVAKYQVNSRPKLPRLFRARNISGEKIFSFCWSAFFLLLLNISRAVNFCFSVWKFRRGREIKTNDFSLLCIISMSTSFPSFQKCSLEILYLTSNRYWKHSASWFRSFSRKDPDGSLNKLNDVSNVF